MDNKKKYYINSSYEIIIVFVVLFISIIFSSHIISTSLSASFLIYIFSKNLKVQILYIISHHKTIHI